jgi:hypothetical protein
MGNYSKDPANVLQDALTKNYARVRFQQGKPILDRELNLLGDLASPQRLAPYIGNGVPASDGLYADKPANPQVVDFYLMPGRCMVNGLELVINDRVSYRGQPHQDNLQFSWPGSGTGGTGPGGPGGGGGPVLDSIQAPRPGDGGVISTGSGAGYVYLRVFLAEVNDTADSNLQNPGDIGFETSLRQKVDWELLLLELPVTEPDYFLLADYKVTTGGILSDPSTQSSIAKSSKLAAASIQSSIPAPTGGGIITEWNDRRVQGLTLEQVRVDLDAVALYLRAVSAILNRDGSLQPNSVTTANIQDNAVATSKLQDLSVITSKLANFAVGNTKLQDLSISNGKLQDLSVGNTKLQDNSVSNAKLQDLSVSTAKLQDNSVTNLKLQNNAVDGNKLAANTVAAGHIQSAAVTYGKIASAAVTLAQLKLTVLINGSYTLAANTPSNILVIAKANTGQDNVIFYSIWGNGDFTWSEIFLAGDRYIKVQNNMTTALTVTVMVRQLQVS